MCGTPQLNVKREEVIEMETRMSGGDVLLDPTPSDDSEQAFGPIAYLSDASHEPTAVIESHQRDVLASDGIANAWQDWTSAAAALWKSVGSR